MIEAKDREGRSLEERISELEKRFDRLESVVFAGEMDVDETRAMAIQAIRDRRAKWRRDQ